MPKRQTFCQAFWDRLVRCKVKPVDLAKLLPGYPEWEIADEMTAARLRLAEEADEMKLRRQMFPADVPADLHGASSRIPEGRHRFQSR